MPSREQIQRAEIDGLQVEDVAQDMQMQAGLAEVAEALADIAATAPDPNVRQQAGRAYRLAAHLADLEAEDERRHRLRGAIEEARRNGGAGAKPTNHALVPETTRRATPEPGRQSADERRVPGRDPVVSPENARTALDAWEVEVARA